MSILDDTALFAAIVQQGGFSRAAKYLGLSNGLMSRRIAKLESQLGVTLLKRTTRQLKLTPEGELFWQHAQRIQQEMDSAICLIQSLAEKPKGTLRVSAPPYFGRHFLMPILNQFMNNFDGIKIELILEDQYLDPIKDHIDLLIRGTGYFKKMLKDSSLITKLLLKQKINLFASTEYLLKFGEPTLAEELVNHAMIGFMERVNAVPETWSYTHKDKSHSMVIKPKFTCNDMDSRVAACLAGHGIGKFTEMVKIQSSTVHSSLRAILQQYDWGEFHIYAVYAQQQALPKRTRLLLDFISVNVQGLHEKLIA